MFIGINPGLIVVADKVKMVALSIMGDGINQSSSLRAIIPLMVDAPEQEVAMDADADSASIEAKSLNTRRTESFFLSVNIGYSDLMKMSSKSKGKAEKECNSTYIMCWSSTGWV